MNENSETRKIPPINYLILMLIFLVVLFSIFYVLESKKISEEELVSSSYLISSNTTPLVLNTVEELSTTLLESPQDLFIFTGYTGDLDEYNLEQDLKDIIDDYNLSDRFYYLNVTNLKEDENFLEDLSTILGDTITSLPAIIYVSNDKVSNTVSSSNAFLEAEDFIKLLEIHDFEKNK
ncbi:MAG: DUF6568 family protein [bacterium]